MGTPLKEWREPPERLARPGRYAELVVEMKKRPGEWMVVYATRGHSAGSIARRLEQKHGVEAITRRNPENDTTEVYARWPRADSRRRAMAG